VVKEVGSGVNVGREHQYRATCFGFRSLETLLERQGRRSEGFALAEDGREDVVRDLVATGSSLSARRYG
jgi:predicted site-specific integrase-resolvase